MNLLNKLTTKNLLLNKKRTIVTIIGIILSVALLTAVSSMYSSGMKSLINFEIRQVGNYHVAYYDVPLNDVDTFRNNRSIDVLSVTRDLGYAHLETGNEYKPYAYVKEYTKGALDNISVNLVEGRQPENDSEIIIPTHLKGNGRKEVKVGEYITLEIGTRVDDMGNILTQYESYDPGSSEEIINPIAKTYKVVGIMERPPRSIEPYSAPGYTFITFVKDDALTGNVDVFVKYTKKATKTWMQATANLLGVDEEMFKLYNSNKRLDDNLFDKVIKEMEKAKYHVDANAYLIGLETNTLFTESNGGLGYVLCIVLGIIVFTSVFCIKNSFDISITEKIKQYGMLRSIGATKKQIRKNVFFESTILGLIGIPIGVLCGCFASFVLVHVSNYFLNADYYDELRLVLSISPIAIISSVLLGVITIYLSAFRSARRAAKVSPIESIRNSADIKIKSKKLKAPKLIQKIFGIGGEISYKNLKRNKKKYRTTVISIVVSVSVFIALTSFMNMAIRAVESEVKLSDYNIYLSGNTYDSIDRYNKYISTTKLDNIDDYTILRMFEFEVDEVRYNKDYINWIDIDPALLTPGIEAPHIIIYSIGDYQYQKYIKSLGLNYDDIKDKAIVMDYTKAARANNNKTEYKTLRAYDYSIGESLTSKDNKSLEIGYITDKKPFGLKNNNDVYFIISDGKLDEFLEGKVAIGLDIYFKSSNPDKLQEGIFELLNSETHYFTNNLEENVRMSKRLITLVGIFLYGFIIVISLIGITSIFNTITTNMELRKPEFAMLKAVGMTSKEFNRMIRLETLFMGFKSILFGLPIGIALSYLIYYFLEKDSGNPYVLPIIPIIVSVIVVFLLISLIMKYSMSKINKQNTIETIRNENI